MKKILYSFGVVAAAAMTLVGCNKTEPAVDNIIAGVPFEFSASSDATKTTNDGMSTLWKENDALSVFHAVSGSEDYVSDGKFSTDAAGATATFKGELASALDASETYDWYAIYPYTSQITTPANTGSTGFVTVGSRVSGGEAKDQVQTGNGTTSHIAGDNYPLAGKVLDVDPSSIFSVPMKHLSSLVKVVVKNDTENDVTVSHVSFTAPEPIVGTYFIDFTGDDPVFTGSGDKYVSATAELSVVSGEAIKPGESAEFFLAVKPFAAASGDKIIVTVTGNYGDEVVEKNLSSAVKFEAGKFSTVNVSYAQTEEEELPVIDISSSPHIVGFELPEGFTAETSYNNTSEKQAGNEGEQWNILSGAISTAQAVCGSQDLLLRNYTSNDFLPYASTAFKLSSLKYITFKAKTTNQYYDLQLYYSFDDGRTWTAGDSFDLKNNIWELFSVSFDEAKENVAVKFEYSSPGASSSNLTLYIDDVEFWSKVPDPYIEVRTLAPNLYENTETGETARLEAEFILKYGASKEDFQFGFNVDKLGGDFFIYSIGYKDAPGEFVYFADVSDLTPDQKVTYYAFATKGEDRYEGDPVEFTPTKRDIVTQTATFTFSEMGFADQEEVKNVTKDDNGNMDVFLQFLQGEGTITPKYFNSGSAIRLYADNELFIDTDNIVKIEFTFAGNSYADKLVPRAGTYTTSGSTGIWEGPAKGMSFTASAQTRITSIKVTYYLND